jgi:hypothetical protein
MKFITENWIQFAAVVAVVVPICTWFISSRKIFQWVADQIFPTPARITERALAFLGVRVSLVVAVAGFLSASFSFAGTWVPPGTQQKLAWSLTHLVWMASYAVIFLGLIKTVIKIKRK